MATVDTEPRLRLFAAPAAETPLADFLTGVYAVQNANLAGGSAASLEDYQTQVRNLEHYFAALLREAQQSARPLVLGDVSDALVAGAMKWQRDRGRAPETANKLRAAVVALVNFAIDELELPLRRLRVKKFKAPRHKPRCWLPDEVLRILSAAQKLPGQVGPVAAGKWFYALELFILNTGTRISAAMNAPTAGLDLAGGWITIPAAVQKHDADEVFDLLPITIAALKAIDPFRNAKIFGDWPFDQQTRQWPTLNRWQRRVLVGAGLFAAAGDVTRKDLFHKLRRSFATHVAAKGGKQLARVMLGHSHESVTDRYLDERLLDRPRMADLLQDLLRPKIDEPQRRLFD